MNKILGVIFVILGIIALIGSVLLFFVLSMAGQAVSSITTDVATATSLGVDPASLGEFSSTLGMFLSIGWLWGLSVLISSIASIWFGLRILRTKSR
ncbi:MAG TPA: hypothetical protein VI968_03580 [archaeon]|nr:hypothetical protein [archaeon]